MEESIFIWKYCSAIPGEIHTYYIKICFMQEGDKSKWKQKIAALGLSLMMTMSLGGDVLAADIPVQEEAAVVSVEDIAGETEDEEITITASATKAYAKTSKVVTLTVKKVAKNGKVTIRKRTPKRKYKITVTAAGKGIYGKKLKVITITIK